MKLLFLTVMPSPYQRQLFAELSKEVDVSVRYFTASAHDRQWVVEDLRPNERVMDGRTFLYFGLSAPWNPNILTEIGSIGPDLTIISDYSAPTAQVAMRALSARRQKFVFWGELPGFSRRGFIGSSIRRVLQSPIRSAAAIAAIGSRAMEAYSNLFPGKKIYNIPYFCDLTPYRAFANILRAPSENVVVLFSGQMIRRKGVDILIEAFVELANKVPRLNLLLLGGGPEQPGFESMVPSHLTSRVKFLGHREPQELAAIFATASAFCLPSRHDGWGVVVNEALGAGLPIIVSDAVGAGPDLVVHGGNGFIVPTGDSSTLANALGQIVNDEVRARMAAASRAKSLDWDISEGVARWRSAAEAILSNCDK